MSFISGTISFQNPNESVVWDAVNLRDVYTPSTPILIDDATFNQLTSTELVRVSQLKDSSTHKARIEFNTLNKTIDETFIATIDSIPYKITGKPKHPMMGDGRITIYLSKI